MNMGVQNFKFANLFESLVGAYSEKRDDYWLKTPHHLNGQQVFVGIRTNRLEVYIPMADGLQSESHEIGNFVKIYTNQAVFRDDGKELSYFVISSSAEFDRELFAALSESIIKSLGSNADQDEIRPVVVKTVEDFVLMLKNAAPGSDSASKIIGLWGELWMFAQLNLLKPERKFDWRGPLMGRHDFILPQHHIEVKTSTTIANKTMEIHGLSQLALQGADRLTLGLIRIDWSVSGKSVADLYAEVVDSIDGRGLAPFKKGYESILEGFVDSSVVESSKFDFVDSSFYEVGDSFPRISNEVLETYFGYLPTITNVRYRLDTSSLPFLSFAEVDW